MKCNILGWLGWSGEKYDPVFFSIFEERRLVLFIILSLFRSSYFLFRNVVCVLLSLLSGYTFRPTPKLSTTYVTVVGGDS